MDEMARDADRIAVDNMRVINKFSTITKVVTMKNLSGECVDFNILGKDNTYTVNIAKSKRDYNTYEFDHLFKVNKDEDGAIVLDVYGYKPDEFKKSFTNIEDIETYLDGVIATINDVGDQQSDIEVVKGYIAMKSTNGVIYEVDVYESEEMAKATAVFSANQADFKDHDGKSVTFENYQELEEFAKEAYLSGIGTEIHVEEATIRIHEVAENAKERYNTLIYGDGDKAWDKVQDSKIMAGDLMKEALISGLTIGHSSSDLHLEADDARARKLLFNYEYGGSKSVVTEFASDIDGRKYYEVAFAYVEEEMNVMLKEGAYSYHTDPDNKLPAEFKPTKAFTPEQREALLTDARLVSDGLEKYKNKTVGFVWDDGYKEIPLTAVVEKVTLNDNKELQIWCVDKDEELWELDARGITSIEDTDTTDVKDDNTDTKSNKRKQR